MIVTLQFDLDKEDDMREYQDVLKVHQYKTQIEDILQILLFKKEMAYLDDAWIEKLEELQKLIPNYNYDQS